MMCWLESVCYCLVYPKQEQRSLHISNHCTLLINSSKNKYWAQTRDLFNKIIIVTEDEETKAEDVARM